MTPPVGLVTFVVSGVTGIPLAQIFRRLTPFIISLSLSILIMIAFPDLALWLPELAN